MKFILKQKVIKPYHLFNHQGRCFVINIEGMFAGTIGKKTAGALKIINAESTAPLDAHTEEELKKLGLISESVKQTPRVKRETKKLFPK